MKFHELLEELNISSAPEGHEHQTEGWIQFDCPFCERDSRRYHMGYNTNGGYINCWRCGSHSLASVLHEYTGLGYKQIKKLIDDLDSVRIQPIMRENIKGFLQTPSKVGALKDVHIRYLSKRGFQYGEIQRLWQVKSTGIVGYLKWRLFIPILHQGRVVSWTTRALRDTKYKYISAKPEQELIPHKNILYGVDYVRSCVIITEGPLDVWAIGPGAVATFGTAFTKQQVLQLIKIPHRIVCYDNEKEAQKQALKLCDALGAFDGRTYNVVLDSKDPGEAKLSELRKLRKFLE